MIKCIISDLGNVLVMNSPEKACRALAARKYRDPGKPAPFFRGCSPEYGEVSWFAPGKVHRLMDTGRLSKRDLYGMAVKNLGLRGVSQKKFESIYGNIFTSNVPVQRIMRKLAKTYRMVLLSNTNPIHYEYARKHFPVLRIFARKVLSYRVGCVKPQPRIFREALRKAGCRPEECVFVDDKPANVEGAAKLGINGIRYTTVARLKADLKRLGVTA